MKKITTLWLLFLLVSGISLSFGANITKVDGDSIPYLSGWNKERVLAFAKGSRPNPSEYLAASYLAEHSEAFKVGAAYLVPKSVLDKYGRKLLGRPDGQFVMSNAQMNQLMSDCKGSLSYVETQLGIPAGSWAGKEIVRIDIPDPNSLHFRMPTGNEGGANNLWLPGGKLPTGFWEAVIDPIPEGKYYETLINLK
ncbi:MAG: hypothetical protein ACKVTZ_04155 [Bacteroidia bacterium]